ncbi:hypothetical protein P9305_12635 [Lysinibacillus capsici]|uniref:SMI1/KNR4 family protein n=1 Tax=Lysinibacillus capsici TaxID=2115968 RepID=UPI002E1DE5EB|nr:hypothetical protein [Lysinibacillus capsici]
MVEVEAELGFELPPSYCWWLKNYDNGQLNDGSILSIGQPAYRAINDHGILSIHRLNYLMNDMIYEYASSFSKFLEKLIEKRSQ